MWNQTLWNSIMSFPATSTLPLQFPPKFKLPCFPPAQLTLFIFLISFYKYYSEWRQIHFKIETNTIQNLDKILFKIETNTFQNLNKYFSKLGQILITIFNQIQTFWFPAMAADILYSNVYNFKIYTNAN